jgi:hypothetical protein
VMAIKQMAMAATSIMDMFIVFKSS